MMKIAMNKRIKFGFLEMTAGLAVLGFVSSLTIDSRLTVIKNDCFERHSIGQRLQSKDVYKSVESNTVPDCQRACTEEGDRCKTFSFGIGIKGNATCELSSKVIKDTPDLKPIGAIEDTDYDLYIKKLGCKLVIEQPDELEEEEFKPTQGILQDNYGSESGDYKPTKPNNEAVFKPESGYSTNRPGPQDYHVETTLISIRPDPNRPGYTGLGPAIGYNDAKPNRPLYDEYGYGRPHKPFMGRPYGYEFNGRPVRPYSDDRYDEDRRPLWPRPYDSYGGRPYNRRPYYGRPYENTKPATYEGGYYNIDRYDKPSFFEENPRPPFRPTSLNRPYTDNKPYFRPGYEIGDEGYSNEIPNPDFDRIRPDLHENRPRPEFERPKPEYERPGYDNFEKPGANNPGSGYQGPSSEYDRPRPEYTKPRPEYDRPRPEFDRPRPEYDRPRPEYDGPRPEYERPRPGYDRPRPEFHRPRPDYDRPRPDYEIPELDRPRPVLERPRPEINLPRPEVDLPYDRPNLDRPRPDMERPQPMYPGPDYYRPPPDYAGDRFSFEYDKPNQLDRPRPVYETRPYEDHRPEDSYHSPPPPNYRPNYRPDFERPRPYHDKFRPEIPSSMYGDRPERPLPPPPRPLENFIRPYDPNNPNVDFPNDIKPVSEENVYRNGNRRGDNQNVKYINHTAESKPIVSHTTGPHGETITSIITEIQPSCFRRALAGKRVARSLIRRALPCERVEDCQQECADEKRFVCEGFNYRLDHTGRGNGDCELIDLPMVRLDMGRDIYTDPDYDIYERDRNSSPDCKGYRSRYPDDSFSRIRDRFDDRRFDRLPPYERHRPSYYEDRRIADRRGDGYYNHPSMGDRYLPKPHYQPPPYLPKRPIQSYYPPTDKDKEYDHSGFKSNRWGSYGGWYGKFGRPDYDTDYGNNFYLPDKIGGSPDWGLYGGSYGTGGNSYSGYGTKGIPAPYDIPAGDSYTPKFPPSFTPSGTRYGGGTIHDVSIPTYQISGPGYGGFKPSYGPIHEHHPNFDHGYTYPSPPPGGTLPVLENNFPPTDGNVVEHKKFDPTSHVGYNFLKDECSLRTATGFKLHKLVVKKSYPAENIYECETFCFKEKEFECLSYAYRYTVALSSPTDNCYLSAKSYKQLDYYTDLEPNRDYDIYTMNNRKKCSDTISRENQSECFWHTRSGQKLEDKVIRHSINAKNIVECQLECLNASKFLCRAFSFRYGSPILGKDNCQLTDWPMAELDPKTQFIPESDFEIYERGSFGHGCEPNHFSIKGPTSTIIGSKTDQLCYVGYGHPARLLPQAIRKSLYVNSELDCKSECTNSREKTLFQCMSFSFRAKAQRGEMNCDLSDILQRDLLSGIDYIPDPDSWLFAWDNYNPECIALTDTNSISGPTAPAYPPTGPVYKPNGPAYRPSTGPAYRPTGPDYGPAGLDYRPTRPAYRPSGPEFRPPGPSYIGRDDHIDIGRFGGPGSALDTWKVYSVSGWPCRRGTLCKENRQAGFWYCELEGGDADTWDYCCRPDHQCGYSQGYPYQWCYVGPARTQWRKCSERYFPYIFNLIDRHHNDPHYRPRPRPYLPKFDPNNEIPPFITRRPPSDHRYIPNRRPGFRPDRPKAPPRPPPRRPSLNEYEQAFDMQFLEPPKPGGFGQARYWPVSYLHREMPPDENTTEYKYDKMKLARDNRLVAIQNLIEIIRSNDINNIQYQIQNKTKDDDILLVKIPLPTNFTEETSQNNSTTDPMKISLSEPIDMPKNRTKIKIGKESKKQNLDAEKEASNAVARQLPIYRRSYITRTNVTNYAKPKTF